MKKLLLTIFTVIIITSSYAQTILVEDFNYTTGDTLASVDPSKGWVSFSGATTNYFAVTASGLTYTGYPGSGVGKAVTFSTSGQDIYKETSDTITSGSIYTSALINVTDAKTAGDYIFGFLSPTSTNVLYSRLYIKLSSVGYYKVGISKSSVGGLEAATYSKDSFQFSTTYLAVIKYQFNAGTNDDSVKVYIFSSGVPATEPAYATLQNLGAVNAGNADATALNRVYLRQGSNASAPTLTIDGIRVATTWANAPLPVKFKSFTATKSENGVNLKWITASESNNKGFELQRSINNGKYQTIGFVKGAVNSNTATTYTFKDVDTKAGTYCYRLKQVDLNGAFEFSKTTCVEFEVVKNNTNEVITTPNPFNSNLNVKYNSINQGSVNVQIIDMIGKTHYNNTIAVNKGENALNIDAETLPLGIYFVRITNGTEVTSQRIIKK